MARAPVTEPPDKQGPDEERIQAVGIDGGPLKSMETVVVAILGAGLSVAVPADTDRLHFEFVRGEVVVAAARLSAAALKAPAGVLRNAVVLLRCCSAARTFGHTEVVAAHIA